jgi:hypothetical protein
VAAEHAGGDAAKTACPVHCRLRRGDDPLSDQESTRDHVDWAGLPINLDLAFSQRQRDKVYMQHLIRKRGARLRRWLPDKAQVCTCETAEQRLDESAVSYSAR